MKRIIFIFAVLVSTLGLKAQEETNKPPINFGIGSSFKMGTFLFPSADAVVLMGPIEIGGFYKYSDYYDVTLNSFGVGVKLSVWSFGVEETNSIILTYDQTLTNSEFEKFREKRKFIVNYSTQDILCIGFKSNYTQHSSLAVKIGLAYSPKLLDHYDPWMEFSYCYYFIENNNNKGIINLLHKKENEE